MYHVCENRHEISHGITLFRNVICSDDHYKHDALIKFRPNSLARTVRELPGDEYWYYMSDGWNTFGRMKDLGTNNQTGILCEINFPEDGLNRSIAGVVLLDEAHNYSIGHRGIIGGGVKGRGKGKFWELYAGESLDVDDGGQECTVALVCGLGSEISAQQLARFLNEVSNIRETEN
ncbi:hypothetical protein ACFL17_08205 [Pseudomonadota bacterium]